MFYHLKNKMVTDKTFLIQNVYANSDPDFHVEEVINMMLKFMKKSLEVKICQRDLERWNKIRT